MQDLIDQVFNGSIRGQMYSGIEATMKIETIQTCILALSVYTEIVGGFVTGKLRTEWSSSENYKAFLPYLGEPYVRLNDEMDKHGTSLHKEVRSKMVHEFQPKSAFSYEFGEQLTDKPGLGYPFLDSGLYDRIRKKDPDYPLPKYVVIRPREYYRDFKKGVEKYYSDLKESMNTVVETEADILKTDLYTKFMNAITVRE